MELTKGQLESPQALRFHIADDDLVVSPRGIEGQSAQHPHGQTIGQIKGQAVGVALPHHGADRCGLVAQAEIDMTRLGPRQIGDLAMQGDIREVRFEGVLDPLSERRNGLEQDSKRIAARAKRERAGHQAGGFRDRGLTRDQVSPTLPRLEGHEQARKRAMEIHAAAPLDQESPHEQFTGIVPGRAAVGAGVGLPIARPGLAAAIRTGDGRSAAKAAFKRSNSCDSARGTLVGVATMIGLILTESTVAVYLSWLHRVPRLRMVDAPSRQAGADDDASIVVVGESSAEGVPFRDWMSVGRIVVWQLRRVFPKRMFHLEVQARAGWTLEQMHQKLAESRLRPDAVILYAGHNEFASRYGWSWEVPHYLDSPCSGWPFRLAAAVAVHSRICCFLRETRDQALIAERPPLQQRLLADAPSHTAAQHQERLDDFRRRLEAILADLQAAGVLTILIIPPANDADFEPNRSVLPSQTPRRKRSFLPHGSGSADARADRSRAMHQALPWLDRAAAGIR